MKKLRTNKKLLKAGAVFLAASMLFSSFLWIAPMEVSAAETEQTGIKATNRQGSVSYYPSYESPEYVLGKVFIGTDGLTDPIAKPYVDEELGISGTYYEPTAYVYFGSYYDDATERSIPLVHRVLDGDADNTGNGGAMFLLSEFVGPHETVFAYNGEFNNDFFTHDNIYSYSVLGAPHTVSNYAGVHYRSQYQDYYENILGPRDYVRKINKHDVHGQMQGLFGFSDDTLVSSLRWDVNDHDPDVDLSNGIDAESVQYLTNATFFPLSAKELNDYVSTVPFAPGVAVRTINGNEYATYWLRTGLEPTVEGGDIQYIGAHDENENGNHVGVVDGRGMITALDADSNAAVRYGFNVETADIVFTQMLADKTHRLAFIEPLYKNTDTPFEAELTDIRGDTVTVQYKNVILDGWHERFVDENYYLSVMIRDGDGNVTHYGSVAELYGNSDHTPDFISDRTGTATFRLPAEYEDGDTVSVFWERKNEYLPEGMSHVSNMVDLGCMHIPATEATCQAPATCVKCGESYGNTDPHHHPLLDTTEYVFDRNEDVHWNVCPVCHEKVNVTNCQFGASCAFPCVCGNESSDSGIHDFDENGVCRRNGGHFERPEVSLSINPYRGTVYIRNEGQLISFARMQNSGAFVTYGNPHDISVFIDEDLDFSEISGYEPIGTAEYPFYGFVQGGGHAIQGILYSSEDTENVGIFGVAADLTVSGLRVENCNFEGKQNVGVLLGQSVVGDEGVNTKFTDMDITDCTVNAISEEGSEGIVFGKAQNGDTVYDLYSHNVTNSDGEYVRLASDESILSISSSVYLYSESGEVARTAEQYASGQVAHERGMRQELGVDVAPSRDEGKPRVGRVSYCDGDLAYYTNERLSLHLPMDRTIHEPTRFYEFVWDGSFAQASVYCAACGQDVLVSAEVEEDYSYVPVRGDYTASITINGETYSETITIIGIHIEDQIGMTYVVKDFDGISVHPEDFMNNHRLDDGSRIPANKEYEVYFVNPETGEKYQELIYDYYGRPQYVPASVYKAGTYDLLVIGENDYEGQEYTYKGALVINQVSVTVTPEDVYKYYDGNAGFAPKFTADREGFEDGFRLVYSEAESHAIGDYVLDVRLEAVGNRYQDSVTYILSRDTVMGYIFPAFSVTVENKSYPTEFTYGDAIPTPTEAHFDISEGSALSFEWYEVCSESACRMDGIPKDVGEYLLRVKATHTDSLVGKSVDIPVRILPKLLSFELDAPNGLPPVMNEYNTEIYYLDMGENLVPRVIGIPEGETLESLGIEISIYQEDGVWHGNNLPAINNRYDFPSQPNMYNYWVSYNVRCSNENYAFDEYGGSVNKGVYVCIGGAGAPTPVLGRDYIADGSTKEVGVVFSWNAPEADDLSEVTYRITITYEGEQVAYHERSHEDFMSDSLSLTHPVSLAGDYTAEIVARSGGETISTQTISFSVSFDRGGELMDSITEMGEYNVIVTSDGDVSRAVELVVKREIVMNLKEIDYFISEGAAIYDKTDVVMEAGKVILLGHELTDVDIEVNVESGSALVRAITVRDTEGNDVSHLYHVISRYANHFNGGAGVAHIYDSPCDADCNVTGCESTRLSAHTGGSADCTNPAVCERCHMEYGSYEPRRHTTEHTHIIPNPDDLMTHCVVHSCCGSVKEIKGHVPESDATCTDRAVCADCGWKYGEINPHNHTSEAFTYESLAGDGSNHLKIRTCCGEELLEAHTGGTATCHSLAQCEFCSAQYGEYDCENHEGDITYAPDADHDDVHTAHCPVCDATWTESHVGGHATCSALAVCESCLVSYGELDTDNHESEETTYVVRAENPSMHDHIHSCCNAYISKGYHSGGEASCMSAPLCELCGTAYGQKNPEKHRSDDFKYTQSPVDANAHVKLYACCGAQIAVEKHTGANTATCEQANVCDVCAIEYGEKTDHVYDNACDAECNICEKLTRPYIFHADENGDQKCDHCAEEVERSSLEGEKPSDGTPGTTPPDGTPGTTPPDETPGTTPPDETPGTTPPDEPPGTTPPDGAPGADRSGISTGALISAIVTGSTVALGAGGFAVFWFAIKKKSLAELLKLLVG